MRHNSHFTFESVIDSLGITNKYKEIKSLIQSWLVYHGLLSYGHAAVCDHEPGCLDVDEGRNILGATWKYYANCIALFATSHDSHSHNLKLVNEGDSLGFLDIWIMLRIRIKVVYLLLQ